MKPYTYTRAVADDGTITFTFTPKDRTETLDLRPDDFQSGAAMRDYVMSWIGTLA